MIKKYISILLLVFTTPLSAWAEVRSPHVFPREPYRPNPLLSKPGVEPPLICDDPRRLGTFWLLIENKLEDPNPMGRYQFKFQTRLFNMACANPEVDSHEELVRKVRSIWSYYDEEYFKLYSLRFDVKYGMISKFAIYTNFDQFVNFMREFRLDLDRIDPADNRTVLDYIVYQRRKVVGEGTQKNLDRYYKMLRDVGAKHASEIRSNQ